MSAGKIPGRVALVHDWLTGMRGGERVLEVLAELYPDAPLFTLFHFPGTVSPEIEGREIRTSFLQRMPFLRRSYRYYVPLFPRAARSLDLRGFGTVISSSHCVAKGVEVDADAVHVCYCHSPVRYAWDRFDDYFGPRSGSKVPRAVATRAMRSLRDFDVRSSERVDRFLANSGHVADRIRRYYGRPSEVIPPPVDTERFRIGAPTGDGDYLMVGALVPYKRVDLAIEAFRGSGRRLRLVGDGPGRGRLERMAGPEVTFLGRLSEEALAGEYARCRALLMPGVEDAGIAPLEAMACGRPVIALNEGGVPEVIAPLEKAAAPTGVLFDAATPEALTAALARFEAATERFDPGSIRQHALGYDRSVFRRRLEDALDRAIHGAPGELVAQ